MKAHFNRIFFVLAIAVTASLGINAKMKSDLFIAQEEPEMAIESWMTEDYHWSNPKISVITESEQELAIESWMYDDWYWK